MAWDYKIPATSNERRKTQCRGDKLRIDDYEIKIRAGRNCKNLPNSSCESENNISQNHLIILCLTVNFPLYIVFSFHSSTSINGCPFKINSNSSDVKISKYSLGII